VDAYTEMIKDQPANLGYVYKYVVGQDWGPYVQGYLNEAWNHGLAPVLIFYTNFDSTSADMTAWDQIMAVVKADGRETRIDIEPDLWAYLKIEGKCGTAAKTFLDRFLSTAPANARLGIHINPWNVPYIGPQDDAAEWLSCWQAMGAGRVPDVYVDVSDRDQEFYGTYPWTAAHLREMEDWFAALSSALGRPVTVWQIPMGNSTCHNGHRSNFAESWLGKQLAGVDLMLWGPGIETGSQAQSWNLPTDDVYDCGYFNAHVGGTAAATATAPPSATATPVPTAIPTALPTATPKPSATSKPPTATPTVKPTATPSCRVYVQIRGKQQWMLCSDFKKLLGP
jgi:hypothetical protein